MGVYRWIWRSHTSSCTPPLCQSGSRCRYTLRTRTGRRRWPACHSTSGCCSPDMCPGPESSHNEGPMVQSLWVKMRKIKQDHLIPPQSCLLSSFLRQHLLLHTDRKDRKIIHTASKIIGLAASNLHDLITESVSYK